MKTWKNVYAAAEFVCAASMTVLTWSNVDKIPDWAIILILVVSIFATYAGIDALKED